MDKLLHVSCIVRASGEVWDLLRALEAHKVGNVEVRPVAPREELLALPAPNKHKKKRAAIGEVQSRVRQVMILKQKMRLRDIVQAAAGPNSHSVYSALTALIEEGTVKKVGVGCYMRVRPDPVEKKEEEAAA